MRRVLKQILPVLLLGCAGCSTQPERQALAPETNEPGPDTTFYQEASWSPDGTRLLLSRLDIHDAYRTSLAIVNADGSGYARLTEGPGDMWTAWSPDGSLIAYASRKEGNQDIYVMNPDGSRPRRLTSDPADDTHPDWSPDGEQMAFVSKRDSLSQVYVMNADGSKPTKITEGPGEKWNPRWSPDGRRLVYYGALEPGKDSVYVVNADGSERRTVGPGIWPSWSPDGSRILYADGEDGIYEMKPDGAVRTQVIGEGALFARWAPDGAKIAFVRTMWRAPEGWPSTSDVFVMNADGSGTLRLTGK